MTDLMTFTMGQSWEYSLPLLIYLGYIGKIADKLAEIKEKWNTLNPRQLEDEKMSFSFHHPQRGNLGLFAEGSIHLVDQPNRFMQKRMLCSVINNYVVVRVLIPFFKTNYGSM